MIVLRRLAWLGGVPVRFVLVGLVRAYRVALAGILGGQCRFHPSCSHYAEEAIRNTGAIRGVALAAWRLARCSPFSRGGVDYPPAPAVAYDADIRPGPVPNLGQAGGEVAR
jgi:putative membrane protein insertion efficiency factor